MNKLVETCNNMSRGAFLLLNYGVKIAFGVLIIGFCAYVYNRQYIGDYRNVQMCIRLVQAAFSLFVQFIIGSIMLDCTQKR